MKVNKSIKIFINYFLGPILFVWLSWSIYNQIKNQPNLLESWLHIKHSLASTKIVYLIAVLLLMLVNWGIEAYKWRLAVLKVQPISFIRAFKAILSGVSFSITTPNRVGEYVGRVLYMSEGNKIKGISITIVCSISQLIVIITTGLAGLFFFKNTLIAGGIISSIWIQTILYGTLAAAVILTLFYFKLSWLVKIIDKLPSFRRYAWVIEALEHFDATLLWRFMSLSACRYFIFITQYYLLFQLFGVELSFWQTWMGISVMILVLTVIPGIALFTDVSLRSELSLKLIGLFSINHLGISLTVIGIWLINLVIPAFIGSLLILGIRNIIINKDESI